MLKLLFVLLFAIELLSENITVTKSVSITKSDFPNLTIRELKEEVLKQAKVKVSNEIYGEFMATETIMQDGHIIDDVIRLRSGGLIHVKGQPKFNVEDKTVEVIITAYAIDSDLEKNYHKLSSDLQKYKKKKHKKEGFIGMWSGFVMGKGGSSISVEIILSSYSQAVILYKSQKCGGDLIVQNRDTHRVSFKEILTFGRNRCQNNSKITLQKLTPQSLEFTQENNGEQLFSGRIYLVKE